MAHPDSGRTIFKSLHQRTWSLYTSMKTERASFDESWKENATFVSPRRPRFSTSDTNKGGRRNRAIIDGAGVRACRTAVAGMAIGITPSSRPWFMLGHPNRALRELPVVREWLYDAAAEMRLIMTGSNFYQTMPAFYQDLLTFSNACILEEDDMDDLVRYTSIPIGEWYVANDKRHQVRTYARKFELTARQVVEKFCKKMPDGQWDFSNVSENVRELFRNSNTENFVQILHMIMPNDFYEAGKLGAKGKKFVSVYWEYGNVDGKLPYGDYGSSRGGAHPLRISGYNRFPLHVGRWGLTSGDVYGTWGPTDVAIGDIRELQFFARMQAEATLKQVDPALKGANRLKKKGRNPRHGEIVWLQDPRHADALSRIYDFNFSIEETRVLREDIRQAINESFYVNMFLRFTQSNRQYLTAKQVAAEENEKLIEMAPLMELLNQDVLSPIVEGVFQRALKKNRLPEPPEELQGQDLQIEYTSTIHQAQKLLDAEALERFTGYIGGVAQMKPSVLDKVNEYELAELYGGVASAPPGVLRSDEEASEIAAARAEQEQREAQLADAEQMSVAAKNLAQAPVDSDNALTAVGAALAEQ